MQAHYFINKVEVHPNVYKQYMLKEWNRAKINDPQFDGKLYNSLYQHYNRLKLNGIQFERRYFS